MVCSSLYETAPVPPASGGWFINAVISAEVTLSPEALLRELRLIEQTMGRPPVRERGGDRSIDLDLLLVGSRVVMRPDLVLPHPRLHLRRFVLVPLCEIAPGLRHPVLGWTMRDLLDRLDDASQVRLVAWAVHPAAAT
jgi:2-amino-4-hydroxy-6-hydroxymethyldihydropteridine diphosphokinase